MTNYFLDIKSTLDVADAPPLDPANIGYVLTPTPMADAVEHWRLYGGTDSLVGLVNGRRMVPLANAALSWSDDYVTMAQGQYGGIRTHRLDNMAARTVAALVKRPALDAEQLVFGSLRDSGAGTGWGAFWNNALFRETTRGATSVPTITIPDAIAPGDWCVAVLAQSASARRLMLVAADASRHLAEGAYDEGDQYTTGHICLGQDTYTGSGFTTPLAAAEFALWASAKTAHEMGLVAERMLAWAAARELI